jgi:hypothetical protein
MLELINHGAFDIEIVTGSPVAQLFIFRCSLLNTPLYHGNYANEDGPTIPILGNGPMRNFCFAPMISATNAGRTTTAGI